MERWHAAVAVDSDLSGGPGCPNSSRGGAAGGGPGGQAQPAGARPGSELLLLLQLLQLLGADSLGLQRREEWHGQELVRGGALEGIHLQTCVQHLQHGRAHLAGQPLCQHGSRVLFHIARQGHNLHLVVGVQPLATAQQRQQAGRQGQAQHPHGQRNLVHMAVAGEQGIAGHHLGKHAACCPDVHRSAVVRVPHQHLGGPVPACHRVRGHLPLGGSGGLLRQAVVGCALPAAWCLPSLASCLHVCRPASVCIRGGDLMAILL
mmetsp:Transcript_19981/g.43553  ORF Transcript_19981/g.43553 Transcript_19981/m.43553 type:complete len:262 (+) Transcript_19981:1922-2707(+)